MPTFLGVMANPSEMLRNEKTPNPHLLCLWSHFGDYIGTPTQDCWLAYAVRGFFENGGRHCYVVVLKDGSAEGLQQGLEAIAHQDTIDLLCVPDTVRHQDSAFEMQQLVIKHCELAGDRFTILDSPPDDSKEHVWEQWSAVDSKNGALYYPWVKVHGFEAQTAIVPPCGHIAGVYSRTDAERGLHKAPANEVLQGVLGLERPLSDEDHAFLNPKRVNCIRSFSGRGIRIWGARTLSGDDAWTYVNVRRLFLTAGRWIKWHLRDVAFEPNNTRLWARIERELNVYFLQLYRQGALKGLCPQEAFYVKCDTETNQLESRDRGQIVTEIGLAPAVPYEFVVVRLIYAPSGVSILGPVRLEQT